MQAKKNRFELAENPQPLVGEAQPRPNNSTKSRRNFRYFLIGCFFTLTAFLLAFVLHYLYVQYNFGFGFLNKLSHALQDKNDADALYLQDRILPETNIHVEQPLSQYYMPQVTTSKTLTKSGEATQAQALQKAVAHYKGKELRQATSSLERIVNGSAADTYKAIALVYLGIIAMERDQYELARHQFLRALKYDTRSIGALANLALLERKLNNYNTAKEYALRARKQAPDDRHVLLLLGNLLLQGAKTDAAIAAYEKAISGGISQDALVYYNLGLSHLRKNNLETAIKNFKRASELTSSVSILLKTRAQLGQAYFQTGQLNLAYDHLQHAARLAPENAKYLYNIGVILLHRKDAANAYPYFERALQAEQGTPPVYRALARALQSLGKPQPAMRALQKALYINPGDLGALFQLGELQKDADQLELAAATFRKIVNITPGDSNTQTALRELARVYISMERYNSGIDVLEKAIGLQSQNPKAYLLLGEIYELAKRRDLAIRSWQKALDNPTTDQQLTLEQETERRIRLALARAYRQEGAFDQALQQFVFIQERKRETPHPSRVDPELELEWANTHLAQEDFANAIAHLKKLSAAPHISIEQRQTAFLKLARAHIGLGRAGADTYDKSDPFAAAINSANKALRLKPQEPQARLTYAWVLLQTKNAINREKALEVLSALTNSAADSAILSQAYNLMGLAYMENNEHRRALTSFDHALQLEPSNKEIYRNQRAAVNAYEKEK